MGVKKIAVRDQAALKEYADSFFAKQKIVFFTTAGGAFFLLAGGTVIYLTILTVTFPGVNVMPNLLYGVVPGSAVVALCTPFFVTTIVLRVKMNTIHKLWMERVHTILENYGVEDYKLTKKKAGVKTRPIEDFVKKNLLRSSWQKKSKWNKQSRKWDKNFKRAFVNEMKKPYDRDKKDKTLLKPERDKAEKMSRALENLKKEIMKPKKKRN